MVARDGEGAQKLVRIDVTGATTARSAHRIAMCIANSPLVKTAIAGEDANWGRIVMAVGKAGEPADRDRLVGRRSAAPGWRARARSSRAMTRPGGRAHAGAGGRDHRRYRPRPRQGAGVDLRPDAWLHRHQRVLPLRRRAGRCRADGREPASGDASTGPSPSCRGLPGWSPDRSGRPASPGARGDPRQFTFPLSVAIDRSIRTRKLLSGWRCQEPCCCTAGPCARRPEPGLPAAPGSGERAGFRRPSPSCATALMRSSSSDSSPHGISPAWPACAGMGFC